MERQSQKLVFENIACVQRLDTAEANLHYWVTELLADYIGERTNLILWRVVTSVYLIIDHSIGQWAYESFNLNLF